MIKLYMCSRVPTHSSVGVTEESVSDPSPVMRAARRPELHNRYHSWQSGGAGILFRSSNVPTAISTATIALLSLVTVEQIYKQIESDIRTYYKRRKKIKKQGISRDHLKVHKQGGSVQYEGQSLLNAIE